MKINASKPPFFFPRNGGACCAHPRRTAGGEYLKAWLLLIVRLILRGGVGGLILLALNGRPVRIVHHVLVGHGVVHGLGFEIAHLWSPYGYALRKRTGSSGVPSAQDNKKPALRRAVLQSCTSCIGYEVLFHELERLGIDLLSHVLRRSTIGAKVFHGPVRNGMGCCTLARNTKSFKFTKKVKTNYQLKRWSVWILIFIRMHNVVVQI